MHKSIFSILLFVSCLFFFGRSKKILEGTKKLFRVIASEQADWESSIFHCIPFRLYEIYSTKCIYYFFNEQNIIYKNKFQKRSVINYLALHKNLWCWTQKHIWTIYSIKTELQFHFISITILLEDTNAPTHKILCHRYSPLAVNLSL